MKKMTCEMLGGACDKEFIAETFEEMAELSRAHGMDMFEKKDPAHLKAMEKMKVLMRDPEAIEAWYEVKKEEFEELPDE